MSAPAQPISVVTGGAGFLGSHLSDRLLAEGHKVIAIDNFVTGNLANIEHLSGNEDYRFVKHNVSNYIFLPEEKLDYVFHFASPASPIDYLEHADPDAESRRARHAQHSRPGQGEEARVSSRLHVRSATEIRSFIRRRRITGAT